MKNIYQMEAFVLFLIVLQFQIVNFAHFRTTLTQSLASIVHKTTLLTIVIAYLIALSCQIV